MNTQWYLKSIYEEIGCSAYESDFKSLEDSIAKLDQLLKKAPQMPLKDAAEQLLFVFEEIVRLRGQLDLYLELRESVNTEDGSIMAQSSRLKKTSVKVGSLSASMRKILAEIPDVDALAAQSDIIKAYAFLLKENKEEVRHLLSEDAEEMISSMNITAGAAWEKLFSYLTSTVRVEYDGGEVTLSEIRNLAYSPNAKERKAAYEAEIASYRKIEDSLAFSLNNIKDQLAMLCEKRGYASPLDMTLAQSKMSKKTLDAMMEAIAEYLPVFRKYLKTKARMLGYQSGLPWYELFAPIGKAGKTYTLEEAEQYLTDSFSEFTPDMADLIKEAFREEWIDFYPRKGKTGGAYCAAVPGIKQSRILTNYDGYFGSVSTLAHELGHAFHNRQIEGERPLNQDYPMPVAETASTFNEIHLTKNALKMAEGGEKLNLLENQLMEQTQCIVDIYSRYLFETAVFEQCKDSFLMPSDLKALMSKAQKEAYGDGLDEAFLHPYMWACKSHYYSADLSFYNFPYAFGSLFAMGLYSLFQKEGEAFVPNYKKMLKSTPCCSIEDAGAMAGIDLTSVDFWRTSLEQVSELVEEFCSICGE